MDVILNHRYLIVSLIVAAVLLAAYRLILWLLGVVVIPDDSVGVVTKEFVLVGKNRRLPDGSIVALNGEAQAASTKAVGAADAEVIRLKINSMEAGNYAVVQVAEALAKSGNKLVPDVVAGGGDGRGGTLVDVLLAGLVRESIHKTV
jgi:hypothetical protein